MFVIADIEWMTNAMRHQSPTQLAAVRVDEAWNVVDEFDALIRPRDRGFYDWNHISYTGAQAMDFLCAKGAHSVLTEFAQWLAEDDVILWWYGDSEKLHKMLVSLILKKQEEHRTIILGAYVRAFLSKQMLVRGNAYALAQANGVQTLPMLMHHSKNDVRVMRELVANIRLPQEYLLEPLVDPPKPKRRIEDLELLPYRYDPQTNLIHRHGCPHIEGVATVGMDKLETSFRRGFKPCECCKAEYRVLLQRRNRDIIERSQYNYIYSPESTVFHKPTCGAMLQAKSILGACHYETVEKTGRTPCKHCHPTAHDARRPIQIRERVCKPEPKPEYLCTPSREVMKALGRQKVAVQERIRRLQDQTLTEEEIRDVYTLTQPRFAFWAGQGCKTFHRYSCAKMGNIRNVRGFRTYAEAVRAGYTPCRHCKPTYKHNLNLSVPITNCERKNEKIEDLELLCRKVGYPYKSEGEFFLMQTPVGRWKIRTTIFPIRVKHINLVSTPEGTAYHDQPRIFLSLADTFSYIKRHDEELLKKTAEREADFHPHILSECIESVERVEVAQSEQGGYGIRPEAVDDADIWNYFLATERVSV